MSCHPMGVVPSYRQLLPAPTTYGLMAIPFTVFQFAPAAPKEQMLAHLNDRRIARCAGFFVSHSKENAVTDHHDECPGGEYRWTYADLRGWLIALLVIGLVIALATQWPFTIGMMLGLNVAMIAVEHRSFRFPFVGGLLAGSIAAGCFFYSAAIELARPQPTAVGAFVLDNILPGLKRSMTDE